MKNWIIGLSLVASNALMAEPLLQRVSQALHGEKKPWSLVEVELDGSVKVKNCYVVAYGYPVHTALQCQTKKSTVAGDKGVEKLVSLAAEASKGAIKLAIPLCTAVPSDSVTYRTSADSRPLWTGSQPCGNSLYNDSAAATDLKAELDRLYFAAFPQPESQE